MDPSIATALAAAIETAINRALEYDPASRQRLTAVTDVLAIECQTPQICLYLQGAPEGVRVMGHCAAPITTHIKGSLFELLGLLKQPASLTGSNIELVGDTGLLRTWQGVLNELDIDWEGALSDVMGDIVGPIAADNLRKSASWAQSQQQEVRRQFSEFLTEEGSILPSKVELENFYNGVTELAMSTDRLQARITRLQDKLQEQLKAKVASMATSTEKDTTR